MKGMLNLLEKAGLVRRVDDGGGSDEPSPSHVAAEAAAAEVPHLAEPPALPVEPSVGLSLEQIYAAASVPSCAYPAERLLRLLEGLKAMDEGLRRQTIQAIDSADDSWTIEDPKRDAAAKVAALERHAASLRAGLAQAEKDTQERLQALIQRQEGTVAEIRRQIADLEGLLAREIARGAQEQAALDAALQSQREAANHEIGNLSRAAAALTGLIAQFAIPVTK
jgi:hypothetical protein